MTPQPKKQSIFALARGERDAPAPLAELLKELEQWRPPVKSPALLQAENARSAAGLEQDRATKALNSMCAVARAQASNAEAKVSKRISAADILNAQQHLADCDSRLMAARQAEEAASLTWRKQYTQEVFDLVGPARAALHDMIGEIDAAMALFRALGNRASAANAGSAWICREAATIIDILQTLRGHLDLDRRIK